MNPIQRLIFLSALLILIAFNFLSGESNHIATAQVSESHVDNYLIYSMRDFGYTDANAEIYNAGVNLTNNLAEDEYPVYNENRNQIIFLSNRGGNYDLYIMEVDGTQTMALTSNVKPDLAPPAWSPSGDTVVFTSFQNENSDLYALNIDNLELMPISNSDSNETYPIWHPSSTQLAYIADGNLYAMNFDTEVSTLLFEGSVKDLAWSPDGSEIAFAAYIPNDGATSVDSEIFILNLETSNLTQVTKNLVNDFEPAWSPDSRMIAYSTDIGEELNDFDIMVAQNNGDWVSQAVITNSSGNDRCPTWSVDGNAIFFVSDRRMPFESNDIYLVNIVSGDLSEITHTSGNESCPLNLINSLETER